MFQWKYVVCGSIGSLLAILATFSPAISAPPPAAESNTFPLAITAADIDFDQTRAFCDGQPIKADRAQVSHALGLAEQGEPWRVNPPAGTERAAHAFQYLIVLRRPLPVGTIIANSADDSIAVRYLRPDHTGAIQANDAKSWLEVPPQAVLPPDTKTRAILISTRHSEGSSRLGHCWLVKNRLASLTSEAVGIAERAPFGSDPNSLPRGEAWRNTGLDTSPGASNKLQRGSVSTALPSWYILAWDAKQSTTGIVLDSNAAQLELFAYVGDPRANPAFAERREWKKINHTITGQLALARDGKMSRRLVSFAPLQTAAIKLEITSTGGSPIAAIDRFDVLTNLGAAPLPKAKSAAPLPFAIEYEQPFDGKLAMVVTDAKGRTIRNLVAQVDRRQGAHREAWDLRDENGATVPPGEYQFKAITSPPLELHYQMTAYPNEPALAGEGRTPWLTDVAGRDGWLADHATHFSGTACGDKIYFGAPGVEGGVSFIECDHEGRKLWAKHSFAGFTGLKRLCADGRFVYIHEQDNLSRLDPQTHEIKKLAALVAPDRQGDLVGMAASKGQVYLAFRAPVPLLDNATLASVVDLDHCLPLYPKDIPDVLGNRRVQPNPRVDFLRLLRLYGAPAGQPAGQNSSRREMQFPIYLESTKERGRDQYIVVAFHKPVPLGSVVFPYPENGLKVEISALKPDAPYPPNAKTSAHWTPFEAQGEPGWNCLAAPEKTETRALRIRLTRTDDDSAEDVLDLVAAGKGEEDGALDQPGQTPEAGTAAALRDDKQTWFGQIEGLKMLRRRLRSLLPEAKVSVNSGRIFDDGHWDAERTEPLTTAKPGIYLLEWQQPQKVSGLAIKEIDGRETRIDVWTGPPNAKIQLEGDANWREVATYIQSRRDGYQPAFERNEVARYLDGYVDFGEAIATRAVRLRVISQWADNGERGTTVNRTDWGNRDLDARRCRVWGVAPLEYLGGEPELDTLAYQRIEVRDGESGELLRSLPVTVDGPLAVNPAGELFGLAAGRVVKIDTKSGKASPVLPEVTHATRFTIDPKGNFFVHVEPARVIEVYDPNGKLLRTIGKPGGQQPGPWDPQKFYAVNDMFIDSTDSLWVVENQYIPRRIVQYKHDGTLVKELYGNTNYGGAGVLSRYDRSRFYHGHVEYELDWKTGRSKIRGLMAEWMPDDLVPVRVDGRLYLASSTLSHQARQSVGVVYLYDEATGTARLVAAMGEAAEFAPLKADELLSLVAVGKSLKNYSFLWSDANGNGRVDAAEVELELKPNDSPVRLGRFNDRLVALAGGVRYEVAKYLADGTPQFAKLATDAPGDYELSNGNVLALEVDVADTPRRGPRGEKFETQVRSANGERLWGYLTDHAGVSGLWVPPWSPGYVTNEFGIIGHETADEGELGEFFVRHANNGQWRIWTADGLLAGNIMLHLADPTSRSAQSFTSAERGARLDRLTAGQEHFHGHFTRADDGKYYIVWGHNYASLVEVRGLEKFKRLGGTFTVTAEDVRAVNDWQQRQAQITVKSQAQSLECLPLDKAGIPSGAAIGQEISFGMSYDKENLYLRWTSHGHGPLENSGGDFQRLFKTGACVDLQMATDAAADPGRTKPAKGDLRLLFTFVKGQPRAVLYQPINPDAAQNEHWETKTEVAGVTAFDRVAQMKRAKLSLSRDKERSDDGYTLSAVVPLQDIGLVIREGLRLKLDWGILSTDSGSAVKQRIYWSNQFANGTSDEALEARLDPHLWGTVVFTSQSKDERRLTEGLKDVRDRTGNAESADFLKELEDELK